MREKVIIVGGGVAGLTAAHELIERDFDVHLFERRSYLGGKSASTRTPSAKPKDDVPLPGEHGFRFFPGWYRHLPATLKEIPFRGRRRLYDGAKVFDNLVTVKTNLMAWSNRDAIPLPLRIPRSVSEATSVATLMTELGRLGLTSAEVGLFFGKLLSIATMSEEERVAQLEAVTWAEYLEADPRQRSRAYCDLVHAMTRTSVAAKAAEVSAYTIGRLAIRTLLDTLTTVDRVLNGPTSETWIDPWVDHLESRGVRFHRGEELEAINFQPNGRKIESVGMVPFWAANARRLHRAVARIVEAWPSLQVRSEAGHDGHALEKATSAVAREIDEAIGLAADRSRWDDRGDGVKEIQALLVSAKEAVEKARETKGPLAPLAQERKQLAELARSLRLSASKEMSPAGRAQSYGADYFIFALPLEQLAYYVNRSPMMRALDPRLADAVKLSRSLDWMAGIQFYLESPFDFASGHIVGVDSEWGLTAIEQTRFWKDVEVPSNVEGILSVDISAWDRKGHFVRKEAFNCTEQEIATEAWGQLKKMINREHRAAVLRDDMLVGGPTLQKGVNFHLDDNIVDIFDRKKQALYEKARAVRFGYVGPDDDSQGEPYVSGPRPRFNVEPLLINRVGTRKLRPDSRTGIDNLFLAGDYVKTETDLACMEGANESARRAVNAILDVVGSDAPRCRLWSFSVSREVTEGLGAAAGVGAAVAAVGAIRAAAVGTRERIAKAIVMNLMPKAKAAAGLPAYTEPDDNGRE